MSKDIQPLLDAWPYDAGQLCVRKITGEDGSEKIQLRIEMGILQMDVTGRPDGQRPYGFESLFYYHQHQAKKAKSKAVGTLASSRSASVLSFRKLKKYLASTKTPIRLEALRLALTTASNRRLLSTKAGRAALRRGPGGCGPTHEPRNGLYPAYPGHT